MLIAKTTAITAMIATITLKAQVSMGRPPK
jgi:hypothetical protein